MRTLLKKLFIDNWHRKSLSLILAIIIWFVVNKSLTTTKTINDVPIKIENIPPGKTVEEIQSNDTAITKVNLTLTGNKKILTSLDARDLQVVFDASSEKDDWLTKISKENLRTHKADINLSQSMHLVSDHNVRIRLSNLVSEKIPIIIMQPMGEPPPGYQFIDIWPYQLNITVNGRKEMIEELKTTGLNLKFNLNDITREELDGLRTQSTKNHSDVVSFDVPDSWKKILIPSLSKAPVRINDENAKCLHIDFLRSETLKLDASIPVSLYFPPKTTQIAAPSKIHLGSSDLIEHQNGIKIINKPLYAKGVSPLFLDVVKNMLEIVVIVDPDKNEMLDWTIQFINAPALEDRYLHLVKFEATEDEFRNLQPYFQDTYLRNRFRNYMNRIQLYNSDNKPFKIRPIFQNNSITLTEIKDDES